MTGAADAMPCEREAGQFIRVLMPGAFKSCADELAAEFASQLPQSRLRFGPFLPSGLLAQAVLDGVAADVLVSASPEFAERLYGAGLLYNPRPFAGNELCLLMRTDVEPAPATLAEALRPELRLVVPQGRTDPCGRYVLQAVGQAGLTEDWERKRERGETIHSLGSGDLPQFLLDGCADVGILYRSEVTGLSENLRSSPLPPGESMRSAIRFVVGCIRRTSGAAVGAAIFADFLVGPRGQRLLQANGFLPPP